MAIPDQLAIYDPETSEFTYKTSDGASVTTMQPPDDVIRQWAEQGSSAGSFKLRNVKTGVDDERGGKDRD